MFSNIARMQKKAHQMSRGQEEGAGRVCVCPIGMIHYGAVPNPGFEHLSKRCYSATWTRLVLDVHHPSPGPNVLQTTSSKKPIFPVRPRQRTPSIAKSLNLAGDSEPRHSAPRDAQDADPRIARGRTFEFGSIDALLFRDGKATVVKGVCRPRSHFPGLHIPFPHDVTS